MITYEMTNVFAVFVIMLWEILTNSAKNKKQYHGGKLEFVLFLSKVSVSVTNYLQIMWFNFP